MQTSIAIWHGAYRGSCGYCKDDRGMRTQSMSTETLTARDYQDMINRGWRRSGTYCYMPINENCCCPQYSIRLPVDEFHPNRKQKKVLSRMENYLNGNYIPSSEREERSKGECCIDKGRTEDVEESSAVQSLNTALNSAIFKVLGDESIFRDSNISLTVLTAVQSSLPPFSISLQRIPAKKKQKDFERGQYFSTAPLKIYSLLKKKFLLDDVQVNIPSVHEIGSGIVGWFNDDNRELVSRITLSDNGFLNFFLPDEISEKKRTKDDRTPKKDSNTDVNIKRTRIAHELKVTTIKSQFREDTYELFKKYQMTVHKEKEEDCTEKSFTRFLINSPLVYESKSEHLCYGSFHQLYTIDDKLVAFGVIDVLPLCVSSVYCVYDTEYKFLSPGIFVALKEIEYAQSLPSIDFYYMGYYIHDNVKMKYKGDYAPSSLLCPITLTWANLSDVTQLLDGEKYPGRFNRDKDACTDESIQGEIAGETLTEMRLLYDDHVLSLMDLLPTNPWLLDISLNIVRSLGHSLAKRILFKYG